MMKSTIVGINSCVQELLLEIISPAIEQLLNRNGTKALVLMPGPLGAEGIRKLARLVSYSSGHYSYVVER